MLFRCKHPANMLAVQKDETVTPHNEDYSIVTYHLVCRKCQEKIDISYAKVLGGVDGMFQRHMAALSEKK
mgnify:CR=1 FL=1